MDKEKIKEAVKVYLQEENSDYAIMLNGKWGSGKTYFVKNELINHIQEQDDRKVIYISLFGITTIDELYNNISLYILFDIKVREYAEENKYIKQVKEITKECIKGKINYLFGKKIENINLLKSENISFISNLCTKGLSILPKSGAINSIVSDINNKIIDFNKYVFIFDDIERTSLKYDVLLGFFDQISDQNKLKAILVCNEDKINEKDKNEFYKTFKEKVVGLTIEYNSNMDAEFDTIVRYYVKNEDVKKYFSDNKQRVLSLFKSADSCNLRTLIFACKRFTELYEKIEDTYINVDKEKIYFDIFFKDILLSVVGSSILIKDKSDLLDFGDNDKITASLEKDKKFSKAESIFDAYKIVYDYLNKYNLDIKSLKRFLHEYIQDLKLMSQNIIIEELNNIYNSNDDSNVISQYKNLLKKISNNEFNINLYPKILNHIFVLNEIVCIEKIEEIKKLIIDNVQSQAREFSLLSWSGISYNNNEARMFHNELLELLKHEKNIINETYWQDIFKNINNFNKKFYIFMSDLNCNFGKGNITLSNIGADKIVNILKTLDVFGIKNFKEGLRAVFDGTVEDLNIKFKHDKEVIKILRMRIEKEIINSNDCSLMKKYWVKDLIKFLDAICKHLKDNKDTSN